MKEKNEQSKEKFMFLRYVYGVYYTYIHISNKTKLFEPTRMSNVSIAYVSVPYFPVI